MTTNHHVALPTNSPVTAAAFEDRFSDLDEAITNLGSGGSAVSGLNVGTDTTLTIASGAVSRTQVVHLIDTEAAATSDDLTNVEGGAEGDILIISAANAGRVVTVKHGSGNIYNFSKTDVVLNDTDLTLEYKYDGARWQQTNGLPTKPASYNGYRLVKNLPVPHTFAARNRFAVRAAAATVQPIGIAAPTGSGTPTASNDTDSTYINLATGAVAGNSAGYVSTTYNLCRYSHNPVFRALLRSTGTLADIANVRLFLGLCSAALTSAATVAGATEAALFRFCPADGDTGWMPLTKDASTQYTGTSMLTVAISQRTLFEIELDAANSRAIFTINNGTPQILTSNLPATSTELGFNVIAFTTVGSAKNYKFSRLEVEYD